MPNICMVAYSDYNQDARIKSYIRILVKNGYQVDLFALKDNTITNIETGYGYRIFRLSKKYRGTSRLAYIYSYTKFFIYSFMYLNWFDVHKKYSAIHVHNMPNFLVFAAIFQRLFGRTVILDNHDLMIPLYEAKFNNISGRFILALLKLEQRYSASLATHIICADHLQKNYLNREFSIKDEKMTVSLNLPHEEIFERVDVERDKTRFNLIYHGTIAKRLGIDIMIEAVNNIRNQIPVRLHIYGGGDYLGEAIALRDRLGLEKEVYILGRGVPTEELPRIVCGMDAGMIGNRNTESTARFMFPVKLLEYVYLGIPVIAPRLEIIRHYFDEDMLLFYEPENVQELSQKILYLYENINVREEIINNSFNFFKRYSFSGKAMDYLNVVGR